MVEGPWPLTPNRTGPKSSLLHVPTVYCLFVSLSLSFPTCQMGPVRPTLQDAVSILWAKHVAQSWHMRVIS